MALSEDQLKAMEASAPLLVAEYRKLQALAKEYLQTEEAAWFPDYTGALLRARSDLRDYLGMD